MHLKLPNSVHHKTFTEKIGVCFKEGKQFDNTFNHLGRLVDKIFKA